MQYDENAEKYGYEGEMTPIECDELTRKYSDITGPFYNASEVDELLAEKDKVIAMLKKRICNGDVSRLTWIDDCIAKDKEIAELKKKLMPCLNGDCILTCEVVEKYGKENAELKQKLEDAKDTAYADSVDAGMRERRLKRALWIARANRAIEKIAWFKLWNASISTMNPEDGTRQEFDKWKKNLGKFLKKAEKFGGKS